MSRIAELMPFGAGAYFAVALASAAVWAWAVFFREKDKR